MDLTVTVEDLRAIAPTLDGMGGERGALVRISAIEA